jgi:hypothetical protein
MPIWTDDGSQSVKIGTQSFSDFEKWPSIYMHSRNQFKAVYVLTF